MAYISINPYSGEEISRFDTITDLELENKLAGSFEAYRSWKEVEVAERAMMIAALASVLTRNRRVYAETITEEMGKPVSQSLSEIDKCATLCTFYAEHAKEFLMPEERKSSALISRITYEPQGVILGIMPWNFPFWQALRFMVPALAGGNSVLLKHASNVPRSALHIEQAFLEAGFPPKLITNLFVSHSQIERVIRKDEVTGVSVTGSNIAGARIGEIAGRNIKRCVMELGGSDPFIIFNDADIDGAIEAFIMSRFQNAGQSCIAAKRLYVQKDSYHRVVDALEKSINALVTGDPMDEGTFIGPLVSEKAASEVDRQVKESVKMGARILTGGKRGVPGNSFYPPTLMVDLPAASPVLTEEVFGPVAPVTRFETAEEAVSLANKTIYGLGAAIWTSDKEQAMRMASKIVSGTVAINGFVKSDPAVPFGGVKDSGYGRELSAEGIREFVNIKTVNLF